jgi:hypothetical protein
VNHDLEERQRRNRVQQAADEGDRPGYPMRPMGEDGQAERDRKADTDGDHSQLDVLDQGRLKGAAPVLLEPIPAEGAVVLHAGRGLAEIGNDRPTGQYHGIHQDEITDVVVSDRPEVSAPSRSTRLISSIVT